MLFGKKGGRRQHYIRGAGVSIAKEAFSFYGLGTGTTVLYHVQCSGAAASFRRRWSWREVVLSQLSFSDLLYCRAGSTKGYPSSALKADLRLPNGSFWVCSINTGSDDPRPFFCGHRHVLLKAFLEHLVMLAEGQKISVWSCLLAYHIIWPEPGHCQECQKYIHRWIMDGKRITIGQKPTLYNKKLRWLLSPFHVPAHKVVSRP